LNVHGPHFLNKKEQQKVNVSENLTSIGLMKINEKGLKANK